MEIKKEDLVGELKLQTRKHRAETKDGTVAGANKAVTKMDKIIDGIADQAELEAVLAELLGSNNPQEVMTGCAHALARGNNIMKDELRAIFKKYDPFEIATDETEYDGEIGEIIDNYHNYEIYPKARNSRHFAWRRFCQN